MTWQRLCCNASPGSRSCGGWAARAAYLKRPGLALGLMQWLPGLPPPWSRAHCCASRASLWIALSITRLLPLLPLLLLTLMLLSPPCRAGDVLFRLGIPAEEFYLLESGTGGVLPVHWYCTALILP